MEVECDNCEGRGFGYVDEYPEKAIGKIVKVECPDCNGDGLLATCPVCGMTKISDGFSRDNCPNRLFHGR